MTKLCQAYTTTIYIGVWYCIVYSTVCIMSSVILCVHVIHVSYSVQYFILWGALGFLIPNLSSPPLKLSDTIVYFVLVSHPNSIRSS